jgi:hypothetical protein
MARSRPESGDWLLRAFASVVISHLGLQPERLSDSSRWSKAQRRPPEQNEQLIRTLEGCNRFLPPFLGGNDSPCRPVVCAALRPPATI